MFAAPFRIVSNCANVGYKTGSSLSLECRWDME
jgi:hypothetical protein